MSQNFGHDGELTTIYGHGIVSASRPAQSIQQLGAANAVPAATEMLILQNMMQLT